MNTNAIGNFDFTSTIGNEDAFFPMYRNWMNIKSEDEVSIAAVVFSLFSPLNNPKTPQITAKKMQDHAEALGKKWTVDVPESQRIPKEYMKLSGSNPFASAFKKLIGAVEHGGDLEVLTTISKCEAFRREKNKEKTKANKENLITAEVRALLIEEELYATDSPEFLAELKARVEKVLGTEKKDAASKKEDEGDKVKTPLDLALDELCEVYRKVVELHNGNEDQAIAMVAKAKTFAQSVCTKLAQDIAARLTLGQNKEEGEKTANAA